MSLRLQLVFVSLLTLVLPWAGCQYIKEMEVALRSAQEQSLLTTAQALAKALEAESPRLQEHILRRTFDTRPTSQLYAPSFATPIVLDGYADDWIHRVLLLNKIDAIASSKALLFGLFYFMTSMWTNTMRPILNQVNLIN